MARQVKPQDAGEMVREDLGAEPQIEDQIPLVDPSPVVADALSKNSPDEATIAQEIPRTRRYRVTRGGSILTEHGYRATIREGKIVDTLNYDLERLRRQGIQMVQVDDELS